MSEEAAAATSEGTAAAVVADTSAAPGAETQAATAAAADTVSGGAGTDSVAAAAGDGPIRPEGLPDQFWEDGKGVKVGDLWTAYRDVQEKAALAAKDVPADVAGYALAIPEGVKLPDGLDAAALSKDPFFAKAQAIAHELKLPKAAFDKFAAAYVEDIAGAHQENADTAVTAFAAAKTALGENADKRIEASKNWLKANLSEAQAKAIMGAPLTVDLVKGLEAIIALRTGPQPGSGASAHVGKFEGLRGADLLDAIRTNKAA
jgi:hypothetical protein